MHICTFQNARDFLTAAEPALVAQEAANNLMYGLALRVQRFPERQKTPPYFAVVQQAGQLLAAALMTPPHNLVVLSTAAAAPATFDLLAADLRGQHWPVPGVLGPSAAALAFAGAWQRLGGQSYVLGQHERVYELRQVAPPSGVAGQMRPATMADLDLLAEWLLAFHLEAQLRELSTLAEAREVTRTKIGDGDFYVWEDGRPVALAGCNRPTPHGYCIGPVYTPPQLRGHGYATALTAALSQLLLDGGKEFTALFTDLSNPISNSIYQKIGYRPVCDFDLYRFEGS